MEAEGLEFYETPISVWLSHSLRIVQQRGGKVISLIQYQEEEKKSVDELMKKVDLLNNHNTWLQR